MSRFLVAYCGGKMTCNGYKIHKSNIIGDILNQSQEDLVGDPKNETDADAFIFDTGGNEKHLHVFKTCCSPRMKCTYTLSSNTKIIHDQTNVWAKRVNDGETFVMANYDNFNDKKYCIGSYESQSPFSGFAKPTTVEFWFKNVGSTNDMPTSTNRDMFKGCTSLTSCEVPCQMRIINNNTFSGCTKLTSYTKTPDFVSAILESAFKYCTSLSTIVIGQFTEISGATSAFERCTNATSITWSNLASGDTKCRGKVIAQKMFKNCSKLSATTFSNCTKNEVYIPSGITKIDYEAFYECNSMTTLNLNGVSELGSYSFYGCNNLREIYGLENVSVISSNAFYTNTSVNTTLKKRDESTYYDLSSVVTIGENAFRNRNFLNEIILTNCTTIGNSAFQSAGFSDNTIKISEVRTIGSSAFSNSNLEKVILSKWGMDSEISSDAFSGCSNLKYFDLGQGVSYVNSNAHNCFQNVGTGHVKVNYNAGLVSGLTNMFKSTSSITLYVPSAYISDYINQYPHWTIQDISQVPSNLNN